MTPIEAIISTLDHALNRPGNFMLGDGKPATAEHFLSGFNTACHALGLSYGRQAFETVIAKRGWGRVGDRAELISALSGKSIKDTGTSDREIVAELFAIEIDCWKSVTEQL